MKSHQFFTLLYLSSFGIAVGQDQQHRVKPSLREEVELKIPSKVFIPPPPPKTVPPMKVEAASASKMSSHTITVLRSDASLQPDLPKQTPHQVLSPMRTDVTVPSQFLSFGATVYDGRLSHLQWSDPRSKISYEAYCSWDCSLLAPFSQILVDEKVHYFSIFSSKIDTSKLSAESLKRKGLAPQVAENSYIIVKGDPANQEAKKVLNALTNIYLKNKNQLVLIQKAKEEYQAAANAWHKANPSQPQNHTIWLKPHRGSRYLKQGGDK